MDLLKDNVGKLYRKFFIASFGSALIACIYGLVDMAMVGQYHGPDGSAAMAVIAPIWNIIYSFGLLCGIGGSVIYAVARGERDDVKEANGYFTSAFILGVLWALILWVLVWVCEEPLLRLFGANDALMPLCKEYMVAPKLTVPVYVFINLLSSFSVMTVTQAEPQKPLFSAVYSMCSEIISLCSHWIWELKARELQQQWELQCPFL